MHSLIKKGFPVFLIFILVMSFSLVSATSLSTPSFSASNVMLDGTQYLNLTGQWTGGTSPYTVNYIITNSITNSVMKYQQYTGITSTYNSFVFQVPSSWAGNSLEANVIITDSETTPATQNSISLQLMYASSPLSTVQFTSSNQTINPGQEEILTATITGGTNSITSAQLNGVTSNVMTGINHPYGDVNGTTLTAWIDPYKLTASTYGAVIFGYQGWLTDNAGGLYYYTNENGNTGGGSIPSKQWSFVTATITTDVSPNVILYINGNQVAKKAFSSITGIIGCQNTNEIIIIGNYGGPCGAYTGTSLFNGSISNAQIYNNVLTPESINALYSEGITGAPITFNGLLGWYLLNGNAPFNGANVINYESTTTFGTPNNVIYPTTYNSYEFNFTVYNSLGDIVLQQNYDSPNNANGTATTSNTFKFSSSSLADGTYTANIIVKDSATTQMVSTNSLTFTVSSSTLSTPTISPSSKTIDTGQNVTLSSTWTGGTADYTAKLYSSSTSSCSSSSTLVQTLSSLTTHNATFSEVSPTSATYYCIYVTDSTPATKNSANSEIIVNPSLGTPSVYVSKNTIKEGQIQTLTANVVGGTPSYIYDFLIYNASGTPVKSQTYTSASTSNSFSFTQRSSYGSGSFTANIVVTDNTDEITYKTISYVVNSTPVTTTTEPTTTTINTGGLPPVTSTSTSTSTPTTTSTSVITSAITSIVTTVTPTKIQVTTTQNVINQSGIKVKITNPNNNNNNILILVNNVTNQVPNQSSSNEISAFSVKFIGELSKLNGPIANVSLNYPCTTNTSKLGVYLLNNNNDNWNQTTNYTINKQSCTVLLSVAHNVTLALFLNENIANLTNQTAIKTTSNNGSLIYGIIIAIVIIIIILILIKRRKSAFKKRR